MNYFKIKTTILLSFMMSTAFAAQVDVANTPLNTSLLVQRCVAADVTIDKNTTEKTATTDCRWNKTRPGDPTITENSDMQITLKIANDVDKVGVHCIFTPSNLDKNARDTIADVAVSKAARKDALAQPLQLPHESWLSYVTDAATGQTEIVAMITNYKNSYDADNIHHQANVIFDLNKERSSRWTSTNVPFNENDTISCTFSPNVIPALSAGNKEF